MNPRGRCLAIAAIVVAHLTVVPMVVLYLMNSWWVMIEEQTTMLALYFGFGSGRRVVRGVLVGTGTASALIVDQWAWASFNQATYTPSMAYSWTVGAAQWFLAPAALLCLLFAGLRPFLGSIRTSPDELPARYGIADLLMATSIVAIAIGLFRIGWSGAVDSFRLQVLALNTGPSAVCAVGCLLIALSRKWWWLGALLLVGDLWLEGQFLFPRFVALHWTNSTVPWLFILVTLTCLRLLGYQLQRPVPRSRRFITS